MSNEAPRTHETGLERTPVPVLTDASGLDALVGKVVTLRGAAVASKMPTLLGVDINLADDSPQDVVMEATGILEREVVTQAEIDERTARSGYYAHRGPGTFYRLRAVDSAGLATARAIPMR